MEVIALEDLPRPIETIDNTWIELSDGCRLAARIWLPRDAEDEPVPAVLEFLPDFPVVVDLAVEGDLQMAGRVRHWLTACL